MRSSAACGAVIIARIARRKVGYALGIGGRDADDTCPITDDDIAPMHANADPHAAPSRMLSNLSRVQQASTITSPFRPLPGK